MSRIIEYLDANLVLYKDLAFKANFTRLLRILWIKILNQIEENLKKDDTVGALIKKKFIFSKHVSKKKIFLNREHCYFFRKWVRHWTY